MISFSDRIQAGINVHLLFDLFSLLFKSLKFSAASTIATASGFPQHSTDSDMGIFDNLMGKNAKVNLKKQFQTHGQIGQGSMSEVYKATDRTSGKTVALKILDLEKTKAHAARFPKMNKPTEGEVACTLIHSHIVKTFAHGISTTGNEFLVMEYVEGHNLSFLVETQNDVMQKHRIQLMIDLGKALEYFHAEGWIHRDLCPRNIMVNEKNQIKMIDFGLVVPCTPPFCQPGNRTGTAAYMAPELIRRQKTDQRLDIFSYAITCYEMYTKELPWPGTQTMDAVRNRINQAPHDIRDLVPDINEQIAHAIMKGIKIEPQDRWQTVTEMVNEISRGHSSIKQATTPKAKTLPKPTAKESPSDNKPPSVDDSGVFEQFIMEVTEEADKEEQKKSTQNKSTKKKTVRKKKKKTKKKRRKPPTDN